MKLYLSCLKNGAGLLASVFLCGCATTNLTPITDRQEASEHTLIIADVFDTYQNNQNSLTPLPNQDSELASNWEIDGYLVADDKVSVTNDGREIIGISKGVVLYGMLLHKKSQSTDPEYVVAIRGTGNEVEWKINAFSLDNLRLPNHEGVTVAKGFYSIYSSFGYIPANSNTPQYPAWQGITNTVGQNKITVIGHSLGATLASYLMVDLKTEGKAENIRARLYASPRPGNDEFAKLVTRTVPDHIVFNNARDAVPQLPPSFFGFWHRSLEKEKLIYQDQYFAEIQNNPGCNHHSVSYAAIFDGPSKPLPFWKKRLKDNDDSEACIRSVKSTISK